MAILRAAVERFEEAASDLKRRYAESAEAGRQLDLYIEGCRYPCMATLNWRSGIVQSLRSGPSANNHKCGSLCSARYGLERENFSGDLFITI